MMMPGDFVAQWPTRCASCSRPIDEGDVCHYTDSDEIVHVECYVRNPRPRVPLAVCPRCNLTRPCEHDE